MRIIGDENKLSILYVIIHVNECLMKSVYVEK